MALAFVCGFAIGIGIGIGIGIEMALTCVAAAVVFVFVVFVVFVVVVGRMAGTERWRRNAKSGKPRCGSQPKRSWDVTTKRYGMCNCVVV